jgi:phosphoglycerate dehydrogenase-like enzyme
VIQIWVPTERTATALAGIDGIKADVVVPAAGALPDSAADVEFYVPPFTPDLMGDSTAESVLTQLPRLKVVQTLTAGVDNLLPHIPAGIIFCNARGVHDTSTAEWAVAAILASVREFPYFAAEQAAGRWSYRSTGCLAGRTVLIVGYGSIGAAVERRLDGFGVTVVRVARRAREGVSSISELDSLLPAADVVVLLVPVTSQTTGMVDAAFLARMKNGALLVNAARGSIVVTDALCAELAAGRLTAALDVTEPEPLPEGHPMWAMPNVFITPHVAASTPASTIAMLDFLRQQVHRFQSGTPLVNVITGDY